MVKRRIIDNFDLSTTDGTNVDDTQYGWDVGSHWTEYRQEAYLMFDIIPDLRRQILGNGVLGVVASVDRRLDKY